MRVFISADIEGIANTAIWDHASKGAYGYDAACRQMSLEVAAACEGAFAAGADYVRVKDAHGSGTNIISDLLPRGVELTRHSCGSPWSMVYGVDEGFDAAMFIGYHCAAGRPGNPLSHTETKATTAVKLNGKRLSEFEIYSMACARAGVPSVFLSGDQMLCDDVAGMHPHLVSVPVKRGYGGIVTVLQPQDACDRIREGVKQALSQDFAGQLCSIPEHFVFEVSYKEHTDAIRASFFPGFEFIGDNTIRMETDDLWDVMTAFCWVL